MVDSSSRVVLSRRDSAAASCAFASALLPRRSVHGANGSVKLTPPPHPGASAPGTRSRPKANSVLGRKLALASDRLACSLSTARRADTSRGRFLAGALGEPLPGTRPCYGRRLVPGFRPHRRGAGSDLCRMAGWTAVVHGQHLFSDRFAWPAGNRSGLPPEQNVNLPRSHQVAGRILHLEKMGNANVHGNIEPQ